MTSGISSARALLFPSSLFFRQLRMVLLEPLAYPLPWGYRGVKVRWLMPNSLYMSVTTAGKLEPIVGDDSVKDPKPTNDAFPVGNVS